MGFRFYRRIRVLPGVTLNLSKRGISASVGVRGAHVTVGHGKVRETVGIPGSGLSYTHIEGSQQTRGEAPGAGQTESAPMASPRWTFGRVLRRLLLVVFLAWLVSVAIIVIVAKFA